MFNDRVDISDHVRRVGNHELGDEEAYTRIITPSWSISNEAREVLGKHPLAKKSRTRKGMKKTRKEKEGRKPRKEKEIKKPESNKLNKKTSKIIK